MGDEEEGQADVEMINIATTSTTTGGANGTHAPSLTNVTSTTDIKKPNLIAGISHGFESNLGQVIHTIKDILSKFQQDRLNIDKDNAQILRKYPKYLTRYSLL